MFLSSASIETNVNLSAWSLPSVVHVMATELLPWMLLGSSGKDGFICLYRPTVHRRGGGRINADDDYRKQPIEVGFFFVWGCKTEGAAPTN